MRFIALDHLKEGMILSKNIYDSSLNLLLKAGNQLSSRYINRIVDLGYQGVYIDDDLSKGIEINDIVYDEYRLEAFQTVKEACIHAYHYSKNPNHYASEVDQHFQKVSQLALKLVTDIKKRKVNRINMLDLKFYDDYIVSHNVNVGMLSLFLGNALGLSTVELQRLGTAALIHDIGKMFLDPKILNKTGKLTQEEFKAINMHSSYSYRYVKESYHIHSTTYLGILYHHEKIDGSGYPKGKKGKDIPLFARIIAICDVYDALTSNRPNRPPLQPSEAFEYMLANGNTYFDMDLLQKFTHMIAPYPKGVEVTLSNGEKGIVLENQSDLSLRPNLRIYKDSKGQDIEPRLVRLSDDPAYRSVTITGINHA